MQARRNEHGRVVEVDSLEQFDALLAAGATAANGWRIQDVDLRDRGDELRRLDPTGSLFLGCDLAPADEESLRDRGALVFPGLPGVPFNPYRVALYSPEELYAGLDDGYAGTLDARVYAWSRADGPGSSVAGTLARALHDHAVDTGLGELVDGHPVVGVMGGHALTRASPGYAEAARLGHVLAGAGLLVATGGGPGAMEAANLGARASGLDPADLQDALARLAGVEQFTPSVTDWARSAFAVAATLPAGPRTVGIPTWFYGHEPPNPFATDIAKLFRNALREDTLLRVCTAGIVFLPGAAGTVQEVFQDACENFYAEPGTRTPMVLVGRTHWTQRLPVWPLLERMAQERGFAASVALVDSWAEVPDALVAASAQ